MLPAPQSMDVFRRVDVHEFIHVGGDALDD